MKTCWGKESPFPCVLEKLQVHSREDGNVKLKGHLNSTIQYFKNNTGGETVRDYEGKKVVLQAQWLWLSCQTLLAILKMGGASGFIPPCFLISLEMMSTVNKAGIKHCTVNSDYTKKLTRI